MLQRSCCTILQKFGHCGILTILPISLLLQPQAAVADSWGVQAAGGVADHHVKKADLGLVWDPNWTWWEIGGWHFAFVAEGHAAYWHTNEGNVHDNIFEFGATPVIRFIRGSGLVRPFVEAGVGVRLITHPRISESYTLSSAFQFADMVGVGAQFGSKQQYQAGFRFQHLSNASIKEPNPGINFSEIYLQYNF
ncbi:acyloxyacyl hydrolase [Paraburkholderia sp. GAS42]|uniref:acyloxyacyl hydrolase n=1 Tax=Paraburkholderia sp. GAS42 TaxID=3035135 RepID=UPI003D1A5848